MSRFIWTEERDRTLLHMVASGCTNAEIAERLSARTAGVSTRLQRLGVALSQSASERTRFERMIDMITDAPSGVRLTVDQAARRVGLRLEDAHNWWEALCRKYGETPSDALPNKRTAAQ